MTDIVGNYNTVVVEAKVKSLAEFENQMEEYKSGKPDPKMDPKVAEEMFDRNSHPCPRHRQDASLHRSSNLATISAIMHL